MARQSQHLDQKLIRTARQLFIAKGVSKLNVRELCELAQVNLGMFHYHFGTKEEFCRIVLQDFYEEFFSQLVGKIDPHCSPLENLRAMLYVLGVTTRDHGAFFLALLADFKTGEKLVIEFVKKNALRHPVMVRELLLECQKQQLIVDLPVEQLMMFIGGAVGAAGLLLSATASWAERHTQASSLNDVLSDAAIKQRIDMALKGVSL